MATFPCSWLLPCLAVLYEAMADYHFSNHPHRPTMAECGVFECKAGKRAIPKAESEYKVFALDFCYNDGSQFEHMKDSGRSKFLEPLAHCCYLKDVCVGVCGITFEHCFKAFWKCAEWECDMGASQQPEDGRGSFKQECLHFAAENGASQIWADRKPTVGGIFVSHSTTKACDKFMKLQKQACDCVPADDYEKALKQRAVDIFKIHEPKHLNKKGEIKNKKLWAKWKGKRAEMFLELMQGFNNSVAIQSKGDVPPPKMQMGEL